MPKYSETYEQVKNLAPVEDFLRGKGRSEQSTLLWQFGLRSYNKTASQSSGSKSSRSRSRRRRGDEEDINRLTAHADGHEFEERNDPMEKMVALGSGGYNLE